MFDIWVRIRIWIGIQESRGPDRKQNDSDPRHCYAHRSEGYLEGVSAEARVAAAVLARVVDDALGIVATGSRLTQGQHRLLHWHTTLAGGMRKG
jgi:hypothetical protein